MTSNLPRPMPYGGATPVPKDSSEGVTALAEFNAVLGFDFSKVAHNEWWQVVRDADGHCEVVVTADGMRVMARFAPRPDAGEFAERIIRAARRRGDLK